MTPEPAASKAMKMPMTLCIATSVRDGLDAIAEREEQSRSQVAELNPVPVSHGTDDAASPPIGV